MTIYEDFASIIDQRVAVKDWSHLPENELEERIEFQRFRLENGTVVTWSVVHALELRII